jgi:hypothetical protein
MICSNSAAGLLMQLYTVVYPSGPDVGAVSSMQLQTSVYPSVYPSGPHVGAVS